MNKIPMDLDAQLKLQVHFDLELFGNGNFDTTIGFQIGFPIGGQYILECPSGLISSNMSIKRDNVQLDIKIWVKVKLYIIIGFFIQCFLLVSIQMPC